ncbi:hypothetical protein WMF38_28000 [Sorangium sp. So ce118]
MTLRRGRAARGGHDRGPARAARRELVLADAGAAWGWSLEASTQQGANTAHGAAELVQAGGWRKAELAQVDAGAARGRGAGRAGPARRPGRGIAGGVTPHTEVT